MTWSIQSPFNTNITLNVQHKVVKKSDGKRKQGKNHANSLVSGKTERPSDPPTTGNSRKTYSKKRELEEDLGVDAPEKHAKTDSSKKVGDEKWKHLDKQKSAAKDSGDIRNVKTD